MLCPKSWIAGVGDWVEVRDKARASSQGVDSYIKVWMHLQAHTRSNPGLLFAPCVVVCCLCNASWRQKILQVLFARRYQTCLVGRGCHVANCGVSSSVGRCVGFSSTAHAQPCARVTPCFCPCGCCCAQSFGGAAQCLQQHFRAAASRVLRQGEGGMDGAIPSLWLLQLPRPC
jgi:hypothetical protein